jgi:hypothetical protein
MPRLKPRTNLLTIPMPEIHNLGPCGLTDNDLKHFDGAIWAAYWYDCTCRHCRAEGWGDTIVLWPNDKVEVLSLSHTSSWSATDANASYVYTVDEFLDDADQVLTSGHVRKEVTDKALELLRR